MLPEFLRIFLHGLGIIHIVEIGVNGCHGHDLLYRGIGVDPVPVSIVKGHVGIFEAADLPACRVVRILGGILWIVFSHDAGGGQPQLLGHGLGRPFAHVVDLRHILGFLCGKLRIKTARIGIDDVGSIRPVGIKIGQVQHRGRGLVGFLLHDLRKPGRKLCILIARNGGKTRCRGRGLGGCSGLTAFLSRFRLDDQVKSHGKGHQQEGYQRYDDDLFFVKVFCLHNDLI